METEENKNNLSDKFDSRQFEINEENWTKLASQLDEQDKKRKRRFFFYFFFAGVALLTGSMLILNYEKVNGGIAENYSETTQTLIKKDQNILNQTSITEEENKNPSSTEEYKETKPANETNNTQEPPAKNENFVDPVKNNMESKTKKDKQSDQYNESNNPGKIDLTISKKAKDVNPTKNEINLTDKEEIIEKTSDEKEYFYKLNNQKEKITTSPSGSSTINNSYPVSNASDSLTAGKDSSVVSINKKDSIAPVLPNNTLNNKKDSVPEKIQIFEIFASAYIAFTPGYSGQTSLKESFNPSIGIGVRKFFNSKIGIGTGLYYTIYGNISNTPKVYQSTTQDFGYSSSVTEIQQSKLHYIKLPLTFELRLKKNIFSIGTELMYLITSSATVKNYNESYGTTTDETSKKEYGYVQGFTNYDVAALLSYSRKINRRFYFNILFNTGFIDVKMNSHFTSQTFDRNKSLQIGTSYKF